jgi:hypothetical protein
VEKNRSREAAEKSLALSGAGRNSLRRKANSDRAENRFSLVINDDGVARLSLLSS